MKLTAQIKLLPTPAQADALKRTLETANAACDFISGVAWDTRTFKKYDLQKAIYLQVRDQFALSAQLAIRVIAKVSDAYKLDRKVKRAFQSLGSVAFDDRILSYNLRAKQVSIWTLDGRLKIPFAAGTRQAEMLQTRHGESDLVFHRQKWYLLVMCEIPEPTPEDVEGILGVDVGIVELATDSDGEQCFRCTGQARARETISAPHALAEGEHAPCSVAAAAHCPTREAVPEGCEPPD